MAFGLAPVTQALDAAAEHLLGPQGSLPTADAASLVEQLLGLGAGASLNDPKFCVALLRLLAGFRKTGPSGAAQAPDDIEQREAARQTRHGVFTCCSRLLQSWNREPAGLTAGGLDFARKLLRMQTLQCCACQLAEGSQQLASEVQPAQPPQEALQRYVDAVEEAGILVYPLVQAAVAAANGNRQAASPRLRQAQAVQQRQQHQEELRAFVRELVGALRESCLLEHCARGALQLQQLEPWLRAHNRSAAAAQLSVRAVLAALPNLLALQGGVGPLKAPLQAVLGGPCARHLLLAAGLALLCAADGGPAYGLPPALLRFVVVGEEEALAETAALGNFTLASGLLLPGLLRELIRVGSPAARLRPGRRGTLLLLGRVGRFAVASARAWEEVSAAADAAAAAAPHGLLQGVWPGGGDPAAPPPPLRLVVLHPEVAAAVAQSVLAALANTVTTARAAADGGAGAGAGAGAARGVADEVERETHDEWWRVAVGFMRHCTRWAAPQQLADLAAHLQRLGSGLCLPGGVMAGSQSGQLVSALGAGLLQVLERLLRRAGADPACREGLLPACLLLDNVEAHNHTALMQMLACGEPGPAAALVCSVGKLLRALAAPGAMLAAPRDGGAALRLGRGLVSLGFTVVGDVRGSVERAAPPPGRDPGAARVPPISAMQWLAAAQWLPPLFRLAGVMEAAITPPGAPHALDPVGKCWAVVLRWAPVLARRAVVADGPPGVLGGPRDAAPAGSGPEPAEELLWEYDAWRHLLLDRLGVVAVLGVGLRVLVVGTAPADRGRVAETLLDCCCCVAASFPAEVRAAAVAAEAAAEASAAAASSKSRSSSRKRAGGKAAGGGKAGQCKGGADGAGAAEAAAGWRPRQVRTLAKELRSAGRERAAAAAEALATQLERWVAGGAGAEGSEEAQRALRRLPALPYIDAAARLLPYHPTGSECLLPACSHPACGNLAGDSEAELPVRPCARCGRGGWCCSACEAAHWGAPAGCRWACRAAGPSREAGGGSAP